MIYNLIKTTTRRGGSSNPNNPSILFNQIFLIGSSRCVNYSTTHHKHPIGHRHSHPHTHESSSATSTSKKEDLNASKKQSITDTPVSIFEQPEVDINDKSSEPLPWDREREGRLLQKKLSDIDEIKWREAEDRQLGSIIYRRAEEVCVENHDLHALPHVQEQAAVNDDKPLEK